MRSGQVVQAPLTGGTNEKNNTVTILLTLGGVALKKKQEEAVSLNTLLPQFAKKECPVLDQNVCTLIQMLEQGQILF